MAGRFVLPLQAVYDANGAPIAGAKAYFYESGTSTPLDTFSDDGLTIANTNPVIADANGRFDDVFLKGQDYKFTLTDSADVTVFTADPVRGDDGSAVETASPTTTYTAPSDGANRDIFADATAGVFTVTLPPVADAGTGTIRVVKVDDSLNAVTVDPDGSETINGLSEILLRNKGDALIIKPQGSQWYAFSLPQTQDFVPLPQGHLAGLALSVNAVDSAHDVDIAAGSGRDADNSTNMILNSALTKRIDAAWAVGTGNGGLDTGSVAAESTYYIWLIKRADTNVVDVLFSLSSTAPTMPASYDKKRQIGMVSYDGSSAIAALHSFVPKTEYLFQKSTASGTSITLADDLDALASATEIRIRLNIVSTSTNSQPPIVRIGPAGGAVSTGYSASVANITGAGAGEGTFTDGIYVVSTGSYGNADQMSGEIILKRWDLAEHLWQYQTFSTQQGGAAWFSTIGQITLASALADIVLTTPGGSATLDDGEVQIWYK